MNDLSHPNSHVFSLSGKNYSQKIIREKSFFKEKTIYVFNQSNESFHFIHIKQNCEEKLRSCSEIIVSKPSIWAMNLICAIYQEKTPSMSHIFVLLYLPEIMKTSLYLYSNTLSNLVNCKFASVDRRTTAEECVVLLSSETLNKNVEHLRMK